jgi:RNA polymerase sigma-70 factor (ECF subfamily)
MKERGNGATRERELAWGRQMAAAQDGDSLAYEALLHELVPALRVFVQSRIRDTSVAEDVIQNVLLSLHRARNTYDPSRPFGPWLRTIARNAVIDAQRARGKRAEREAVLPEADRIADEREPSRAGAPLSARMTEALASLPPAQREAVELIQLEELSVIEAAARAGVSVSAIKVRAHRGYKALRALLGGRERDE